MSEEEGKNEPDFSVMMAIHVGLTFIAVELGWKYYAPNDDLSGFVLDLGLSLTRWPFIHLGIRDAS